jgi:hypothetical protein
VPDVPDVLNIPKVPDAPERRVYYPALGFNITSSFKRAFFSAAFWL